MRNTKSKIGNRRFSQYLKARYMLVTQAYKKPSSVKIAADNRCRGLMIGMHGTRYRITVVNSFYFSSAFSYKKDGVWYMRWMTAYKYYDYKLTEDEVKILHLEG